MAGHLNGFSFYPEPLERLNPKIKENIVRNGLINATDQIFSFLRKTPI